MKSIPARDALRNRTSMGTAALWSAPTAASAGTGSEEVADDNGGNRVYADNLKLIIKPKFKLNRNVKIFASGSCFAREIELALHNRGIEVMSWRPGIGLDNSTFHRYNTFSIINDFDFAFRREYGPEFITKLAEDKFADFTGYGTYPSIEAALDTRNRVIELHRNSTQADLVILTLGLVEAWYDNVNEIYFNTPPYPLLRSSDGRLELRISNFAENFRAVQDTISLLTSANPAMKILLTVSPVPLSDTFSGQDVVTANAYSKSVLRSVAQEISDDHDNVDYFPSYEIVMMSNPATSWMPDHRHVRREQVAHIVAEFERYYLD